MLYAYELPPPTSVGPGSEVSGDEERLSIGSTRSGTQREAAQTFTTIQRTVRPGNILSKSFMIFNLLTICFFSWKDHFSMIK